MKYLCDAPDNKTWFQIETESEAVQESADMNHAVEKYFRNEQEKAVQTFQPASTTFFEQEIGLRAHLRRAMPMFLTLRNDEGKALATAMLPPGGGENSGFRPIIVGCDNADPYPDYAEAIRALSEHFGIALDRERCCPYRRT